MVNSRLGSLLVLLSVLLFYLQFKLKHLKIATTPSCGNGSWGRVLPIIVYTAVVRLPVVTIFLKFFLTMF